MPGTINRFRDAPSGVFNWAIRTRRLPKGTLNPCHAVKKHPKHPGIVRFLDDDERVRLLAACRASSWPRLYALVLMGITTGGRRSELCGLHWRDVDLERRQARIITSKNDSKERGIVCREFIDELTSRHVEVHANYYGTMVWILMMLEQWFGLHRATARAGRPSAFGQSSSLQAN
jgi:integrase